MNIKCLFRVTFVVARGQHPVEWSEVFDTGVIKGSCQVLAQVQANALLPNAIRRHQESTEDPEISDEETKDCRAVVEPLSEWVRRGIENGEAIQTWKPELKEDSRG